MSVWRVGYFESPCEFTPRDLCDWNHRFDDPQREYRTIYAADKKETCLREVLADLRPNKKTLADFKKFFGGDEAAESAGVVTGTWRARNVLARADIQMESGEMANIESAAILAELTERLARQLESRGIKRLDLTGPVPELVSVCGEYGLTLL